MHAGQPHGLNEGELRSFWSGNAEFPVAEASARFSPRASKRSEIDSSHWQLCAAQQSAGIRIADVALRDAAQGDSALAGLASDRAAIQLEPCPCWNKRPRRSTATGRGAAGSAPALAKCRRATPIVVGSWTNDRCLSLLRTKAWESGNRQLRREASPGGRPRFSRFNAGVRLMARLKPARRRATLRHRAFSSRSHQACRDPCGSGRGCRHSRERRSPCQR